MVTGDHPLTAEAIARKVRGQTVRRPLQSNNKTNEKKSPSSVAPSFQLNRIALQVNIVHDFATREEIARGASVGGGGRRRGDGPQGRAGRAGGRCRHRLPVSGFARWRLQFACT